MSYYSKVSYTGDGSTATFSVPFPYIDKAHVLPFVNGLAATISAWPTPTTVTLSPTPANGAAIEIKRVTKRDSLLVTWSAPLQLKANDLNLSAKQIFYIAQETLDSGSDAGIQLLTGAWNAASKRLINLASPTSATDAVNAGYLDSKTEVSVCDFGFLAKGDGTTDDSGAINAAIAAVIAAGGGVVRFPHKSAGYFCAFPLIANWSALSGRFNGRLVFKGEGAASFIKSQTLSVPLLHCIGGASNQEGYLRIEGLRFAGNGVAGSVGVQINNAAYVSISHCTIEGFDIGLDTTDVDQCTVQSSQFRWNSGGVRLNPAAGVTNPNSFDFLGCAFANNTTYGVQAGSPCSLNFYGGSVQYNGTIAGGTGQGGLTLTDIGADGGYPDVNVIGVAFEGNGGGGDFVNTQTTTPARVQIHGCSFIRTNPGGGVGYGTNNIRILGTNANAAYSIRNCSFRGSSPYVPNVARPVVSVGNANCKIDAHNNFYENSVESPTWPAGQTLALPVEFGGTGDTGTAWTQTTPVPTPATGAFSNVTAVLRRKETGKSVNTSLVVINTANGTGGGNISVPLPFTVQASTTLTGKDVSTAKTVVAHIGAGSNVAVIHLYDGTYPGGTGSTLILSGICEKQ